MCLPDVVRLPTRVARKQMTNMVFRCHKFYFYGLKNNSVIRYTHRVCFILFCLLLALSKEPVAPVPAPQPQAAPGQQQHEVTIQFQQSVPPPTGPAAPVEVPLGVTTTMQYPMLEEEEEPPRFTMPLRNQTVTDGDRAELRVFFSGVPAPTVTWYFNSQPVRPGQDFQINVDVRRGESTLVIVEVFPEDEGEYMCKAENPLGTAITHCHLFVRSEFALCSQHNITQHHVKVDAGLLPQCPVQLMKYMYKNVNWL